MSGKCAENVHRLHELPGQDVQKMCIVQDCAQIVYGLCIAQDCAQIVSRLCIIYMTVPSKNSSPSSNSIPNSILSLRFLSLGMFRMCRMFLVLIRVRVDIRLRVFFKVPVAVATARINSENFRLRAYPHAYPHNASPFQLDIRARSVINAIASSKISSLVPSSTASRNRRPWGRATRRFYEGQR